MMDARQRRRAYRRAASLIEPAQKILCASPELPDGDSVGCVTAMHLFLLEKGKEVTLWAPDPIPDRPIMRSLPGTREFLCEFPVSRSFDLILAFDYGALDRVRIPEDVLRSVPVIGFDHHRSGSFHAPHGFAIVNPDAASATMLLYEFFKTIRYQISPDIAHCLLVGICTDTASFQSELTTKESFLLAAKLWDRHGASVREVRSLLVPEYSLRTISAWREILNHHIEIHGDVAILAVPRNLFENLGLEYRDVASLMQNLFRYVREFRLVVLLVQEENGQWRGALRPCAVPRLNLAHIAEHLGGGGHENSAGFSSRLPLEEIRKTVLDCVRNHSL